MRFLRSKRALALVVIVIAGAIGGTTVALAGDDRDVSRHGLSSTTATRSTRQTIAYDERDSDDNDVTTTTSDDATRRCDDDDDSDGRPG